MRRTLARVNSDLSLSAHTQIQEWSEHHHAREEQKDASVDQQTFNISHLVPALVHPEKQRQGNDQQVETCKDPVGRDGEQALLRYPIQQGQKIQSGPTTHQNLECPQRGRGGIGRRTRLKIVWAVRPVGVQVPLPPSVFFSNRPVSSF